MKLIEPETKNFQAVMQSLQKSRDFQAIKIAREQFMDMREKHKISSFVPLLTILQVFKVKILNKENFFLSFLV